MLEITPIPAFSDNYIWLLSDPDAQRAVVVDPGDAAPVQAILEARGLELAAILVTHHHPDHVGGVGMLAADEVPVYGPAGENIPARSHALRGGDRVELLHPAIRLEVIEVPGHTLGHIAFAGEGMLFAGDALFSGGCGRLFEGTAAQMLNSLSALRELPGDSRLYCGHEYTLANLAFALAVEPDNPDLAKRQEQARQQREQNQPTLPSRLDEERLINPFLRWDQPTVKAAVEKHAGRALETDVEVFAELRGWKDTF